MKKALILILFPFALSAQFDQQQLKNAPTSLVCDSNQTIRIETEFYYNTMPGANSNRVHGGPNIVANYFDAYHCPNLQFQKWFYFYDDDLVVQSRGIPQPWKEGQHKGSTPDRIVAEFREKKTGKYIYLRTEGSFPIGEVP